MSLQQSVNKTYLYAAFFGFPLFLSEVQHWLISPRVTLVLENNSVVSPTGNSHDKIKRRYCTFQSINKIKIARKLGRVLNFIPGIRLVAITGSVAANNSQIGDDIDLLIVTSPHTMWILRPFVLAILTLFFRRRRPHEDPSHTKDAFCPNLWLDTTALTMSVSKRNIYTAHEILQIVPLVDKKNTYGHFLLSNSWTKKFLANAYSSKLPLLTNSKDNLYLNLLFLPLNMFFYIVQIIYMYPKKTTESISLHTAFLHTTNYSGKLTECVNSIKDI